MTESILPEGANWLTPYLTVGDAQVSLDFYHRAFGFEPGNVTPGPDGKPVHVEMHYAGRTIVMFAPEGSWGGTSRTPAHLGVEPSVGLYVYCADVDALAVRAAAAGAKIDMPPEDMFWGDRAVGLTDPDGHRWTFATRVGEFDPSKIPQMG